MQQTLHIIEKAIKKLELVTGVAIRLKTDRDETVLQLQTGNNTLDFSADVKKTINAATIGLFKQN